jgi:L-amino acid N-acyltransferase YncA
VRTPPRSTDRRSASPTVSRRGPLSTGRVALNQILLPPLTAADWPAAARIYEAGIVGGNATFESAVPSWEEWSGQRAGYPALIAREGADGNGGGAALGWAALGPVSSRAVYRGVGEVSIYVDPARARRGVGRALLQALIETSEREGFWTLRAGIFPENLASIAVHERCGFQTVGVSRRIGQMSDGRWRDVLWFERRSAVVGSE